MTSPALNFKDLWKPFLIAAALAFVYATVLIKLGADWWTDENYSHGLLVPPLIGYIIWLEFDALKNAPKNPSVWLGFALIVSALVLLLGGTLGAELFTRRVSFVLMLAGVVVCFWGARTLKLLAAPFALLLLAIPIPQIIFNKIALPLQTYASQTAIWGMRFFEVPSVRKGNVIEILPHGATQIVALEVVEACSGIRSLMTLVTLALVLAYFTGDGDKRFGRGWFDFVRNFDFWRAIILMLSAIPIAIITNAARVTATGVLTYRYGKRAMEGALHDASGWLVYVAALGLLLLVNMALKRVLSPKSQVLSQSESQITDYGFQTENQKPKTEDQDEEAVISSTVSASSPRPRVSVSLLAIVLLVGGIFINWFEQRGEVEVARQPLSKISAQLGEWRQKGDAIRFGTATETVLGTTDYMMREYAAPGGRLANLYVGYYASQRFGATYHSPLNCLPSSGWVMTEPQRIKIKSPSGKTFTANKFIIENGVYNEVLIYWYQGRGRATASEYADKINTIWDSVLRRRSDGAMVRVMTRVGDSETEATAKAADLAAQIADELPEFVPE
ncbi:MAG: EpsI family protein [Acidobacteria bacterium]|nr:EpsI family protein [Acidobacteriota bacterium]